MRVRVASERAEFRVVIIAFIRVQRDLAGGFVLGVAVSLH